MAHVKDFSDTHESFETEFFVTEHQEEETCHKVHSLTVLNLWVEERISLKNVVQDIRLDDVSETMEGSLYIHCN